MNGCTNLKRGLAIGALAASALTGSGLVNAATQGTVGNSSTGTLDVSILVPNLVLVNNPEHNTDGDFALEQGLIKNSGDVQLTFSGIGLYTHEFFADTDPGKKALAPILRKKSELNKVSGEYYNGQWIDIGTIERLAKLRSYLS